MQSDTPVENIDITLSIVNHVPTGITLHVYDDKKEKHQSFEAFIPDLDIERGYGSDLTRAVADYRKNLRSEIDKLTAIGDTLDRDLDTYNIQIQYVNGMGEHI